METLWFIIVALMLTAYVMLDGFDLGAGVIYLIVAKTSKERRTVLRAIGPVWDGNEVWLLLRASVDQLQAQSTSRHSRLVHGHGRRGRAGDPDGARGAVRCHQDRRRTEPACQRSGRDVMASAVFPDGLQLGSHLLHSPARNGQLPGASLWPGRASCGSG